MALGYRWEVGAKTTWAVLISSNSGPPSPLSVDLKFDAVNPTPKRNSQQQGPFLQGPRTAPLTSSTVHRATSPAWMLATPGRSLQCCSLPRGRSRKGWADTEDMKTDWCNACCVCSAEYSERGRASETHVWGNLESTPIAAPPPRGPGWDRSILSGDPGFRPFGIIARSPQAQATPLFCFKATVPRNRCYIRPR